MDGNDKKLIFKRNIQFQYWSYSSMRGRTKPDLVFLEPYGISVFYIIWNLAYMTIRLMYNTPHMDDKILFYEHGQPSIVVRPCAKIEGNTQVNIHYFLCVAIEK